MKKRKILSYSLSLFALLQLNTLFAQQRPVFKDALEVPSKHTGTVPQKAKGSNSVSNKTVLFTETFNGSSGSWTTTGADAAIWKFDMDGPNGQYSDPVMQIIKSTTASNGFMIFDADLSNPGTSDIDRAGQLVSPVIDLTGKTDIAITFEHSLRFCCSNSFFPKLEVSTDNFSTFDSFNVGEGIVVNQTSGTMTSMVMISSWLTTATNLNNFKFRFNFDGVTGGNTSHYFWQLDDISVFVPLNNDLEILATYNADVVNVTNGMELSMLPSSQFKTFTVSCDIKNIGINDANTSVSVTVNDGTSDVGTFTKNVVLASEASDNFVIPTTVLPSVNKKYTFTFNLASDDDLTNNTGIDSIRTNDYELAHDYPDTNRRGFFTDMIVGMGNWFNIAKSTKVYGIDVEFEKGTTPGAIMEVQLLDNSTNLIASGKYIVKASDIDAEKMTGIMFDAPVDVFSGEVYMAMVFNTKATDRLIIGSSAYGNEDQVSMRYGPFGSGGTIDFFNHNIYCSAVRMNFNPACDVSGLSGQEKNAVSCNPNSGEVTFTKTAGPTNGWQFSWDGPTTGSSSTSENINYTVSGLLAGNYDVSVSKSGCNYSFFDFVIGTDAAPSATVTELNPVSCNGSTDGSLGYTTSGTTTGYSFVWSNGSTASTISGLSAGTYTLTMVSNYCSIQKTHILTEPSAITVTTASTKTGSCGGSDGSLVLNVSGSSSTYQYNWSGPSTGTSGGFFGPNFTINNLPAGSYQITINDGTCSINIAASVSDKGTPVATVTASQAISCNGENDGTLQVGGVGLGGYDFTWNTGVTGKTLSNVSAGFYWVSYTDGSCTASVSFELTEPDPLTISVITGPSAIAPTVNGGSGLYTYSWSGPGGFTSASADLSGLSTLGTYTLTVTDTKGCTATASVDLLFLGLDDIAAENQAVLYPNPVNSILFIENAAEIASVELLDFTGKLCGTFALKIAETQQIDLQMQAAGAYLCRMLDTKGQVLSQQRLMIQH